MEPFGLTDFFSLKRSLLTCSNLRRQLRHQQSTFLLPEAVVLRGSEVTHRGPANFRRQEVAIPGNP